MNTLNIRIICLLPFFATLISHAQEFKNEVSYSERKFSPAYDLRKMGNTTIFQGNNKKRKYFEGWYFKMVSEDGSAVLSVIPGISLSKDGKEQHAFIQLINGVTAETSYFSFSIDDFSFDAKGFAVKIGDNYFSKEMIILNLKDENTTIHGKVQMLNLVEYSSGRWIDPGIMGWYRFVPLMECYHGVVSLTHDLVGQISVGNQVMDFSQGKGYIEKDWGSSMPSSWIWMQSNSFTTPNTSFMLSVANIPWVGRSFTGFLGYLYHDNKRYDFATYLPTKLSLEVTEASLIKIKIQNKRHTIIVEAESRNAGLLHAPVQGSMDRRIAESIDAYMHITLLDKLGNVVFTDSTNITGLEKVGDYRSLQK